MVKAKHKMFSVGTMPFYHGYNIVTANPFKAQTELQLHINKDNNNKDKITNFR